jgi:hypothetical protein
MVILGIVLLLFNVGDVGSGEENIQHYKVLSSVEYSGETQFNSQVGTILTVKKKILPDGKVQYVISSSNLDLVEGKLYPRQGAPSKKLSFNLDNGTRHLSVDINGLKFLEKVNNNCVSFLKEVTKDNVGKTWKQSFNMPFLEHLLEGKMRFTLTAIQLNTKVSGEMIAVRALSEPFIIKVANAKGGKDNVRARINSVYLFDTKLEDIYMSISVFEAETNSKEKLRHEVATYKTDATGKSVDLSGLGKEFEKLASKLGLADKSIKAVKKSPLPQWVQHEGLAAGQAANICAAIACEGALNPVTTIFVPTNRIFEMQLFGDSVLIEMAGPVSRMLGNNVIGMGSLRIAAPLTIPGLSPATAALVAGGGAAAVVGAGGGGGGDHDRSPSTP